MALSSASMEAEDARGAISAAQRYLTLATVVLGSSLYGTALLTTSTVLPQMQGALSATQDEIAWAMTFNILATAIVTPMTGWLAARFREKHVMGGSIGMFTPATTVRRLSGAASRAAAERRWCRCRRRSFSIRFRAGSTRWCSACSAWRWRSRRC